MVTIWLRRVVMEDDNDDVCPLSLVDVDEYEVAYKQNGENKNTKSDQRLQNYRGKYKRFCTISKQCLQINHY